METRRLLWVTALLFSVFLLVQYIELPYGYVLSSLLSLGKFQETSPVSFSSASSSNTTGNLADKANFTGLTSTKRNGSKNDLPVSVDISSSKSSVANLRATNAVPLSSKSVYKVSQATIPKVALPPLKLPSQISSTEYVSTNRSTHIQSPKSASSKLLNNEKPEVRQIDLSTLVNNSSSTKTKRRFKGPPAVVVPISAMNDMLSISRISCQSTKPHWPSKADQGLLNVKGLIKDAPIADKNPQIDATVYRNFSSFVRSYELMEQTLKIYIYSEGEKPIFHQPELHGIYASEGWFMKQLEENKHFVTKNADKAHIFYLPFSSHILQEQLYVPDSHSRKNLVQYLSSYLQNITTKYSFWNRTGGADHFLVACHDWAPAETSRIMKNCIRALCNAAVGGGFKFSKDVSLPEIYVRDVQNPLKDLGGKPASQRPILAFFAGNMHGYLRPILLNYWQNKDPQMKIFGNLHDKKGQMSYKQYMKSSKYCISVRGYEPYTPRVVEAIYYECIPVIISDNYVPPFFETLNWESFAVFVQEKDIPNLKNILVSIPEERYIKMQERVRQVQKHFLWHSTPVKYDVFHMILHSIWYTWALRMRSG